MSIFCRRQTEKYFIVQKIYSKNLKFLMLADFLTRPFVGIRWCGASPGWRMGVASQEVVDQHTLGCGGLITHPPETKSDYENSQRKSSTS